MPSDDYEAVRKAVAEWVRVASTPQYRRMVEIARQRTYQRDLLWAAKQTSQTNAARWEAMRQEALRAIEDNRRLQERAAAAAAASPGLESAVRAAAAQASKSRQVLEAASSMQPALNRFVLAEPTWMSDVARALSNPTVLGVLKAWQRLAQQQGSEGDRETGPTFDSSALLDPEALNAIADSEEIRDLDLDAFEREISGVDVLDEMLEMAADQMLTLHPFMTKPQARRAVVVLAFVAWMGVLVGVGILTTPVFAVLGLTLSAAGMDAPAVSKAAGKGVDLLPGALFAPEQVDPPDANDGEGDRADPA